MSSSNQAFITSLEQEKARLRLANPHWSEEQLRLEFSRKTQTLLSYLVENSMDDAEIPRSFQQGQANASDLLLAIDGDWCPSDPLIDDFISNHGQPVPMSRASLSTPSFNSFGDTNTGSKRGYQYVNMDYSSSYTCGMAPYHASSMISPHNDEVRAFAPADYVDMLHCEEAESSAVKKQKLDPVSDVSSCSLSSSFNVTPMSSMSMNSLSPSQPMSRQNSMANSALTNAVRMMRLGSSSSVASDLHPVVEDPEQSFLSSRTERPPNDIDHDFSFSTPFDFNVDFPSFPAVEQQFSMDTDVGLGSIPGMTEQSMTLGEEMRRSDSDQSTGSTSSVSSSYSATSAKQKSAERRRKHLENAKQVIAMKKQPSGSKSTMAMTDAEQPDKPSTSSTGKLNNNNKKQVISKTRYERPKHPKVMCKKCNNYPEGFKGDHELRRHDERAHQTRRKVWIITEPPTRTEHWPESPVSICKRCKSGQQYPVDYNAAAHLRRMHFVPIKRGRRAKGETREERAGKAGGDWPRIDWLKESGWLTEIEVGPSEEEEQQQQKPQATQQDLEEEEADEEVIILEDDLQAQPSSASTAAMAISAHELRLTYNVLGWANAFAQPHPDEEEDFAFYLPQQQRQHPSAMSLQQQQQLQQQQHQIHGNLCGEQLMLATMTAGEDGMFSAAASAQSGFITRSAAPATLKI